MNVLQAGSIHGVVYFDQNLNGQRDAGEKPWPGATVQLVASATATEKTVKVSTTSDSLGTYRFDEVEPGRTYFVQIIDLGTKVDGSPDYAGVFTNPRPSITVASGGSARRDFGAISDSLTSTIRVIEFFDSNQNGHYDPGERLLDNANLTIDIEPYNVPVIYGIQGHSTRRLMAYPEKILTREFIRSHRNTMRSITLRRAAEDSHHGWYWCFGDPNTSAFTGMAGECPMAIDF